MKLSDKAEEILEAIWVAVEEDKLSALDPQKVGVALDDPAIAPDVEMRRYLYPGDGRKIGVSGCIEAIEEKVFDPFARKFIGRQADVVQNDQRHRFSGRPFAKVRRGQLLRSVQPALGLPDRHSMPRRSRR